MGFLKLVLRVFYRNTCSRTSSSIFYLFCEFPRFGYCFFRFFADFAKYLCRLTFHFFDGFVVCRLDPFVFKKTSGLDSSCHKWRPVHSQRIELGIEVIEKILAVADVLCIVRQIREMTQLVAYCSEYIVDWTGVAIVNFRDVVSRKRQFSFKLLPLRV